MKPQAKPLQPAPRPAMRQEILDQALARRGLTDHSPLPPRDRGVPPTRQTARRRRRDPVRRLAEDGALTAGQVEAAEEILRVLEALMRAVTRPAHDPGGAPSRRRGQHRPMAGFLAEPVRPLYRRYLAWAEVPDNLVWAGGASNFAGTTSISHRKDTLGFRASEKESIQRPEASFDQ